MRQEHQRGRGPWSRWALATSVFAVAFVVSGVAVDWLQARDGTYSFLKLFNETLLLVRNNYVEEVETPRLMLGAFEGMLASLDPQTEYLTRDQYERLTGKTGEDDGDVGLDLTRRGGYLYVVSALPGSPAEEAGIKAGVRLRRIAGVATREMTLSEAQLLLRGKAGSAVEVQRFPGDGDEDETVRLTRVRLRPARLQLERQRGAVVLRLPTLSAGTADAAQGMLKGLAADGEDVLLLDLRGNSTGSYEEAASVASLFVGSGEVGRIRSRAGEERILTARRGAPIRSRPVALLVDEGTAGASELLAQALRLRAGAELVGHKTFGRGTLQDYIPLNDGGYLHLSVARCVDPEGVAWDGQGLTPDREVEVAAGDERGDDPVLREALRLLGSPGRPAA